MAAQAAKGVIGLHRPP